MASIRLMRFINLLLLFNPAAAAMKYGYIGPTATSVGLVGIQRMAPRPTRPPSMEESTGELRKRRLPDSIYSLIPKAWCGFVDGDFDDPYRCRSGTCVYLSTSTDTTLACSPFGPEGTPIIYNYCLDSTEYASMSTAKLFDTTVCSLSLSPYCQVATLPRGEYDLYCDSTSQRSTVSLEYLEDWFATGSNRLISITTSQSSTPTPIISITPGQSSSPTPIISIISSQSSPTTATTSSSGGGLAAPAIAGIGVAVGAVVVGAIAGLGICLFLRRRKRKEGTNQPVEVSTGPSKHSMQQGNLGQGWQTVAPASSPYPNSQTAFLKNPEQPSPPYSSQPASIPNTHSPSLSSPVMPYDSISRTGSTGLYPLSQNPSATAPSNNKIPPSLMPSAHKPGELPRFNNSSDHTAQPPSPISGVGQHGGETRSGSPIDNQVHEMATGFSLHNNPRGSVTSQSPPYHEVSSSVASPTRQSSGTQSPPPLHPIHEAPAYHNENQARGIVSSPTSRQSGPGAYYEAAHPPREISAGDGGSRSYSNNISSNTGQHDMSPPTPAAPAVVAPTSRIKSGTYEGQQQAQYDIHKAPATNYTAYSPGTI